MEFSNINKPIVVSNYSRLKCAVPGCNNIKKNNLDLSFHHFPVAEKSTVNIVDYFGNKKEVDRLEAWKLALKMINVSTHSRVCSLHFKDDNYYFPG